MGTTAIGRIEQVDFGIVAALETEFVATKAMLDDVLETVSPRGRVYAEGTIPSKHGGIHRVALVLSSPGTAAAATSTALLAEDYPEVSAVLMVGIAGAIPDVNRAERHVRLGDVIISGEGGVVAYDLGKELRDRFVVKSTARTPHHGLVQACRRLKAAELTGDRAWLKHMTRARDQPGSARPDEATDWIADSADPNKHLRHPDDPARRDHEPRVFLGTIACANRVLKNPIHRDSLRDQFDVRAVEMEAFGIAEATWHQDIAYLVVRGTCDYCDDNKGDIWQPYAAIAAAAYMRALLGELPTSRRAQSPEIVRSVRSSHLSEEALRRLAQRLLDIGTPPSVRSLFQQSNPKAHEALSALETTPRTFTSADGTARVGDLDELANHKMPHHAIEAPPGSGKTFALWQGARKLLAAGPVVPLYLPIGRAQSWSAVLAGLARDARVIDPATILSDPRVCLVLDGWSEFVSTAEGDPIEPWRSLLGTRVIVSRRRGTSGDQRFCAWNLEPLSESSVRRVLLTALPGAPMPPPDVAELLRLPLALSLHVLLGGAALSRGELLAQLHDHLSRGLPREFREILAGSVAATDLANRGRSRAVLVEELDRRCRAAGIADPLKLVERLGTLDLRGPVVIPIHELYWSWLSGLGVLSEGRLKDALPLLRFREGVDLALEAGCSPADDQIEDVRTSDVPLAAVLYFHQTKKASPVSIRQAINELLVDKKAAVRCRGVLAGLLSRDESLLQPTLAGWTAARNDGIYDSVFENALDLRTLFRQRGSLSAWVGSLGTDQLLGTIASRGGAEWSPWLEQLANCGQISLPSAVGAALACTGEIPPWTTAHLEAVLLEEPYRLRPAAIRGSNGELAAWIADHYDSLIEKKRMGFYDLNSVLATCGNEVVFDRLLKRFSQMTESTQKALGYAITKRGEPWISRFQEVAFAKGDAPHHYELLRHVSAEVSDGTARSWIRSGPKELGWRVLIARHGNGVLEELLEDLPRSFEGLDHIPELVALRDLPDPPDALADVLWARAGISLSAAVAQDLLLALAPIKNRGIPSVAVRLARNPDFLPSYHLIQFLHLYRKWAASTGLSFNVRNGSKEVSFAEWLVLKRLPGHRDDSFFGSQLGPVAEIVVPIFLDHFEEDEDEYLEFIVSAGSMPRFDARVVERLFERTDHPKVILKLFSNVIDRFPESVLLRLLESSGTDFGAFVRALAPTSTVMHRNVHLAIMSRLVERPFDMWEYRYVAQIIRGYSRWTLRQMFKEAFSTLGERELWLVRETEKASGELLVDESCQWLS